MKIITLLIFLLVSIFNFSQSKIYGVVILKTSEEKATFYISAPERKVLDSSKFFIIPDTIKNYKISTFYSDYNQYIYQRNSANKNDTIAATEMKRLKLNSNSKYSKEKIDCYRSILLFNRALDGNLMFIFDSNGDGNFTNEKQYNYTKYFENDSLDDSLVNINNIQSYDSLTQKTITSDFNIKPIVYKSKNIDSIQLFYKVKNKMRSGSFILDGHTYNLCVYTNSSNQLYDSIHTFFYINKLEKGNPKFLKLFDYYRLNEMIKLEDAKSTTVKITKIDSLGFKIEFKVVRNFKKLFGNKINEYLIKSIKANELITDRKLNLEKSFLNHKFNVIEFWGTWCVPCLNIMNDYEKVVLNFSPLGVQFISIAYDKSKEIVKEFLNTHQRSGVNIFDKQGDKAGISALMNVDSYPSFFVFDRTGKIIFRDEGTDGFQKLSKFLKSKL